MRITKIVGKGCSVGACVQHRGAGRAPKNAGRYTVLSSVISTSVFISQCKMAGNVGFYIETFDVLVSHGELMWCEGGSFFLYRLGCEKFAVSDNSNII